MPYLHLIKSFSEFVAGAAELGQFSKIWGPTRLGSGFTCIWYVCCLSLFLLAHGVGLSLMLMQLFFSNMDVAKNRVGSLLLDISVDGKKLKLNNSKN